MVRVRVEYSGLVSSSTGSEAVISIVEFAFDTAGEGRDGVASTSMGLEVTRTASVGRSFVIRETASAVFALLYASRYLPIYLISIQSL